MPGSASGLGKRTRHQPDTAPQADSTPRLRRQLAELSWRDVEAAHRSVETGHGRREIRTLKVVTIAAGIAFPHAAQAIQLTRRTRPASRNGMWRTETVYAITDLRPHQARPDELAAWIRGHWQIENALHWVRDVTFAEDLSQVRTGTAPRSGRLGALQHQWRLQIRSRLCRSRSRSSSARERRPRPEDQLGQSAAQRLHVSPGQCPGPSGSIRPRGGLLLSFAGAADKPTRAVERNKPGEDLLTDPLVRSLFRPAGLTEDVGVSPVQPGSQAAGLSRR
jgi:hypothetical protein